MTLEDAFDIEAPLAQTWPVLMDIPRVAGCIPNAEITDILDSTHYRAKVSVKVGPVSVSYKALVTVAALEPATHTATFEVHGDEIKGRGGVRATVTTSAVADGAVTRISLNTEAHISGTVATVGGRLIESVARKTIAEFAKRLTALIAAGTQEPASAGSSICAILAAGRSTRMGAQKLLFTIGEATLLERALAAAANYPRILVAGSWLLDSIAPAPNVRVVVNDAPERGMAHSLRLADAAAEAGAALAVVLADTPFVDAALVRRVVTARGDADVAYPVRDGVPGHPVVFGPRPRRALADVPDGDTLRHLRADARWTRVEIPIADHRPFLDVDTPADFQRARAMEPSPPGQAL